MFTFDNGVHVMRTDVEIINERGHKLVGSHFEPMEIKREWEKMPCVVYCHGNSSCRLDALDLVKPLLSANITLFCFDFSGSGLSEGEYISLGWFERDDVACVTEYLRLNRNVSTIGLWGRSMGAATSLLHGDRDPTIGGMLLDSPFSNLRTLCDELAYNTCKVPSFMVGAAMALVSSTIREKADFDVAQLTPITHVGDCYIPAIFATGEQDTFIAPHHCDALYEAYAGEKQLVKFEGTHNSERSDFFKQSSTNFFVNCLKVTELLTEETKMTKAQQTVLTQKY